METFLFQSINWKRHKNILIIEENVFLFFFWSLIENLVPVFKKKKKKRISIKSYKISNLLKSN